MKAELIPTALPLLFAFPASALTLPLGMKLALTQSPAVRAAPVRPPATPAPVPQVGQWHLVRRIYRGDWSEVFQACPAGQPDAAMYALKMVADDLVDPQLGQQLLRTEARLGQAISHPHVVPVLDCQVETAPYFLVMPLLEGVSLRAVIASGIAVPLAHLIWIARQAATGLAAIHQRGWLHADIKPENIHIAPGGHATLLDLGLAQPLRSPGCALQRALTGTLRYTAPEWLVSTSQAGAASDIYSLGAVLYEALAGRAPFDYQDARRLALAHLEETPVSLRVLRPELPSEICQLVQRMLAKEPLRRPGSVEELAGALRTLETFALAQA